MLKALDLVVRKCPDLAGFWNWDNSRRMKFFSNLVVLYLKNALVSKKPKKLAYIRLLVIYLKKNQKFDKKLDPTRISEMVYDLAVDRYKQARRGEM